MSRTQQRKERQGKRRITVFCILALLCVLGAGLWLAAALRPAISAEQTEYTGNRGETLQLQVDYAGSQPLQYASSDESVLTVDQQGLVRLLSPGQARVSITAKGAREAVSVLVSCLSPCQSVSLDGRRVMTVGQSQQLQAQLLPEDTTDTALQWSVEDAAVARVDQQGTVTALAEGKTRVTAVNSASGVSAGFDIAVYQAPEEAPGPEMPAVTVIGTSATGAEIAVSEEGVTYVGGIAIANKTYGLPRDYAPGVNPLAQEAMDRMIAAAAQEGLTLFVRTSYRSYAFQNSLYTNYAAKDGVEKADTYSARPGFSEHQLGLAFDINSLDQAWGETAEGKWLAENCCRFGFVIRYTRDKEAITGYKYEPWHVRYLGTELALEVYDSGLCLEEYLGITSQYQ